MSDRDGLPFQERLAKIRSDKADPTEEVTAIMVSRQAAGVAVSESGRRTVDTTLASVMAGETVRVSLHTGPLPEPAGVSSAGYTRAHGGETTWTSAESVTHAFLLPSPEPDDDPYELHMTDATPTGVGDPLADVLRSIDDLLEGQ